jgi:hypothetical protein
MSFYVSHLYMCVVVWYIMLDIGQRPAQLKPLQLVTFLLERELSPTFVNASIEYKEARLRVEVFFNLTNDCMTVCIKKKL